MVESDPRKLLYAGDGIKIYQTGIPDEHDVEVGKLSCYLGRGILKELAEADSEILEQSLGAMNPRFLRGLQLENVSFDKLGWAISKARISELEQEVQYFVTKYNKLRVRIE